jgi:hypothetical protein
MAWKEAQELVTEVTSCNPVSRKFLIVVQCEIRRGSLHDFKLAGDLDTLRDRSRIAASVSSTVCSRPARPRVNCPIWCTLSALALCESVRYAACPRDATGGG